MSWLRALHRYIGVVAAILLFILAVTGGVLIFKQEIWSLRFPALSEPWVNPSAAQIAEAFGAIQAEYADGIRLIRVPQPDIRAYHVYLETGEVLWRQDGAGAVAEWAWFESPLGVITELHRHLAAGDFGNSLLGWLGLVATLMAVSGMILWWPVRHQFRVASLRPRRLSRSALLRMHRDLGVLTAVLIILFALTASAVVFGQGARNLLNHLLSPDARASAPVRVVAAGQFDPPSGGMIERVIEALPGARLMSWSPPRPENAVHYFRLRQVGEVHPYGRSTVHIDARSGRVLAVSDATRAPVGDRVANWMYPLHAARWGGVAYRVIALAAALVLVLMSLTGIICFVRGLRSRVSKNH
ncbi:PepSY-associated TM helix domain-containing protein [Elongatibacter sediminis]|uniref:PepSY-associated TM helix domain-containing protein n=1 Tax=Elongatibacter sediminis TaxID=3119006 RepID=A0AAW9RFZ2_9GAMM